MKLSLPFGMSWALALSLSSPVRAQSAPAPEASPSDVGAVRVEPVHGFASDLGLGLGVRADVLVTHGRVFGVSASDGTGDGWHGVSGGVAFQLAYHVPLPSSLLDETPALVWLDRTLGMEAEVAYALTGTQGELSFTQYEAGGDAVAPVTTTYSYGGLLHQLPISLGVRARLPLLLGNAALAGLRFDVSAGGATVIGISSTTARLDGAEAPFAQDNTSVDAAWGFYVEGGLGWQLGPGEVTASYRYSSAYLSFGHTAWNPVPGDLGGHHLLVGYRFLL